MHEPDSCVGIVQPGLMRQLRTLHAASLTPPGKEISAKTESKHLRASI